MKTPKRLKTNLTLAQGRNLAFELRHKLSTAEKMQLICEDRAFQVREIKGQFSEGARCGEPRLAQTSPAFFEGDR